MASRICRKHSFGSQATLQTLPAICMAIFGEYARSAQDAVHAGARGPFCVPCPRPCPTALFKSSLYPFHLWLSSETLLAAAPRGEKECAWFVARSTCRPCDGHHPSGEARPRDYLQPDVPGVARRQRHTVHARNSVYTARNGLRRPRRKGSLSLAVLHPNVVGVPNRELHGSCS